MANSAKPIAKSQVDKFREAARELETDDREEAFDATLKKVAKAGTLEQKLPNVKPSDQE